MNCSSTAIESAKFSRFNKLFYPRKVGRMRKLKCDSRAALDGSTLRTGEKRKPKAE